MSTALFKKQLKIYAEYLQEVRAKAVLIDLRQFAYTVSPDEQIWIDTQIVTIEQNIINKQAILSPEEFIAELSVEQTMEEENAQSLTIAFFSTEKEAIEWLTTYI